MTVSDMYSLMQYCINKDQNGYLSPDDFNLVINQGQRSYASWLIGQYQQFQNQKSQPRISWGQNQTVRESLTPIIYGYILNADSNGLAPYPADYQKGDAITTIYGFNKIRFASQDRLSAYMGSTIDPVATNPIFLVTDEGFQFYPITTSQARLSYVKNPPPIKWGYTLDADGLPVFDAATSIDPVWSDVDCWDVVSRSLRIVGVNLMANVVSQYANEITKGGQ